MSVSKSIAAPAALAANGATPFVGRLPPPGLRRLLAGWAVGWLVPLGGLALWQGSVVAGWLPPQILPRPTEVWALLLEMLHSGELADHLLVSLGRVAAGFAAGASAGLVLGIAMGVSRRVEAYLYPSFLVVAQIPPLGWIPLLMMLVGIDEALKVLVIAKAALIPMALNTRNGIRAVPHAYVEVARVFGFSPWVLIRRVYLPATVPPVFTGVRYGMTHAWLALVAVELLASSEGLGYLMVWGRQLFQLETVIVAMLVVGLVGLALDRGLETVERRLSRWRVTPA